MRWICFDLNGTLTDPRALTGDERGLAVLELAVVQAMTDTLTGTVRAFPDYVRAALERLAPDRAEDGMAQLPALPAQPGAAEALAALA